MAIIQVCWAAVKFTLWRPGGPAKPLAIALGPWIMEFEGAWRLDPGKAGSVLNGSRIQSIELNRLSTAISLLYITFIVHNCGFGDYGDLIWNRSRNGE